MVRYATRRSLFFLVRERLGEGVAYRPATHRTEAIAPDLCDEHRPIPSTTPTPSRSSDDEIATLAAHIHAATHRLLILIAEFDRRRGWELGGHRSCAHWLAFRTGIDLGAAREKVRTARALDDAARDERRPWPGASCRSPRSGR